MAREARPKNFVLINIHEIHVFAYGDGASDTSLRLTLTSISQISASTAKVKYVL